jgi:hypothetical protein
LRTAVRSRITICRKIPASTCLLASRRLEDSRILSNPNIQEGDLLRWGMQPSSSALDCAHRPLLVPRADFRQAFDQQNYQPSGRVSDIIDNAESYLRRQAARGCSYTVYPVFTMSSAMSTLQQPSPSQSMAVRLHNSVGETANANFSPVLAHVLGRVSTVVFQISFSHPLVFFPSVRSAPLPRLPPPFQLPPSLLRHI